MPYSIPGFYSLLDQLQAAPLQALSVNQSESCKQYIYTSISIGGFASFSLLFAHTVDQPLFLGHENGIQVQVTTSQITESKENKSIRKLDLSGSTGPGEEGGELPPPIYSVATALYNIAAYTKITQIKELISLY